MCALAIFTVVVVATGSWFYCLLPQSAKQTVFVSTEIGFTTSDEETTLDSFLIFHGGRIPME